MIHLLASSHTIYWIRRSQAPPFRTTSTVRIDRQVYTTGRSKANWRWKNHRTIWNSIFIRPSLPATWTVSRWTSLISWARLASSISWARLTKTCSRHRSMVRPWGHLCSINSCAIIWVGCCRLGQMLFRNNDKADEPFTDESFLLQATYHPLTTWTICITPRIIRTSRTTTPATIFNLVSMARAADRKWNNDVAERISHLNSSTNWSDSSKRRTIRMRKSLVVLKFSFFYKIHC